MIAVDTNLLVYAHREDSALHKSSLDILKELIATGDRWAIPWPCVHEFLAIVTHPRIYTPPSPLPTAISAMQVWLNCSRCRAIGEGPGYYMTLARLLSRSKIAGAMVHDARVAAICIHNGVQELWSADRDFSRFPDLRVRNPLISLNP